MPVQVDPTLREQLNDDIDVTFVVRSPDLDQLDAAMPAVIQAIWDLGPRPEEWPDPEETPSPSYVSDPVRIPGGRLVTVDFHDVPENYRTRLPDALAAVLSHHGISEARLEAPQPIGDHYLNLDRFLPLIRAWLHDPRPDGAPRFTARPSEALVDAALTWLGDMHQEPDQFVAVAGGVEVPLSWPGHRQVVDNMLASPGGGPTRVLLLSTDFDNRADAVELGALNGYGVLLTSGRHDSTQDHIVEQLRDRRDLIRRYPGRLEWAGVMLDYTARTGHFLVSPHQRIGPDQPGAPLWYQLLSPAHVEQLGRVPEGGVSRPDGSVELTIGEPESWIRENPSYGEVIRYAQELLAPPRRPGIQVGQRLSRAAGRSRMLVVAIRSERERPEAVRAALARLRAGEPELWYVSDPIPGPNGPLVVIDAGDVPVRTRRELPERIRSAFEAAGVTAGDLDSPPEARTQPYLHLARIRPVVRAWLRTHEPVNPAGPVVDAALSWIRDQHQPGDRLVMLVDPVELPLTWDDHRPVMDSLLRNNDQQTWTPLIQTDFDTHAAYLDLGFSSGHGLLLTIGDSNWSDADLTAQMANLRSLIDRHATELDHADIALDQTDQYFILPHTELSDPAEHAATWYQLLSTAQLERHGDELPEEAVTRPDGRVELIIGEPLQWLPGHPDRDHLLRRARHLRQQ